MRNSLLRSCSKTTGEGNIIIGVVVECSTKQGLLGWGGSYQKATVDLPKRASVTKSAVQPIIAADATKISHAPSQGCPHPRA